MMSSNFKPAASHLKIKMKKAKYIDFDVGQLQKNLSIPLDRMKNTAPDVGKLFEKKWLSWQEHTCASFWHNFVDIT